MSDKIATTRTVSTRGQFCVPVEFRNGVVEYGIEVVSTDENGNLVLKLHPNPKRLSN
jgi:bifunctional DNA-binding transcriptional regulator/antitoxin component of YhaV-PrlF toxin-antitoxin module